MKLLDIADDNNITGRINSPVIEAFLQVQNAAKTMELEEMIQKPKYIALFHQRAMLILIINGQTISGAHEFV